MKFKDAVALKFAQGRASHDTPWDADHVDVLNEIRGELCDLYNYATLLPEGHTKNAILGVAESVYGWVDEYEKEKAVSRDRPFS